MPIAAAAQTATASIDRLLMSYLPLVDADAAVTPARKVLRSRDVVNRA
jgi:hypothetical protein